MLFNMAEKILGNKKYSEKPFIIFHNKSEKKCI